MKNLSQCALALTLAFGFSVAHAQMASAPSSTAPMSKAEPRPAGTTPPNTAPYSPSQADTPDRKKITSAQKKEARSTRDAAIKACASETDAKAKKTCVRAAKETYHRAITP